MPNNCLICKKIIANGYFCQEHFKEIDFISEPSCTICSYPFEFEIEEDEICAKCLSKKPQYDELTAIFKYNDFSKKIIFDFKYNDKLILADFFAKLIHNSIKDYSDDINFISFVPLHKKRLRSRKYNQSALIAKKLAKISKTNIVFDLIIRKKNTKPQFLLSKSGRKENLKGAFIFNKKYQDLIKNKNILIIDDVFTTGATIESCSKILKKNKAKKVYIAVLARRV